MRCDTKKFATAAADDMQSQRIVLTRYTVQQRRQHQAATLPVSCLMYRILEAET